MQQENIRYVLVWSGWIRLIHWLMAAGVLFLFASAWAIQHGNVDYEFWRDWHMIVGQLLLITVAARVILMFLLPGWFGEIGIWYAGPMAEMMMLGLTAVVLWHSSRDKALKWGIFHIEEGAAS